MRPEINFLVDRDLVESIDDLSPGNTSWSHHETSAVLVYDVPWKKHDIPDYLAHANAFFLGSAWLEDVGGDNEFLISRTLPFRHPRWRLYAQRISQVQGVKVMAKDAGYTFMPLPPNPPVNQPAFDERIWPHQEYWIERTHVEFAGTTMNYWDDNMVRGTINILTRPDEGDPQPTTTQARREWLRWCKWTWKPYSEFLTAQGWTFSFAEGPRGPIPANPATGATAQKGQPIEGAVGYAVGKAHLQCQWIGVPREYILTGQSTAEFLGVPENLMVVMGRVNSRPFLGCDKHTLLMDTPPVIDEYPNPIQLPGAPAILCDITLSLKHFDPPKGTNSDVYGHQLMPDRDGKWYLATRKVEGKNEGDPTSPRQYEEIPYEYLFLPPKGRYRIADKLQPPRV